MAKVTSKLQVTIPKAIADDYGIEPGDQIRFEPAGDNIRVVLEEEQPSEVAPEERLRLFDAATQRQRRRDNAAPKKPCTDRGWTREDAYRERLG